MPTSAPDGNPWPKVSIVTPSFNQGEFLEETIRSVLLQNYPNLEYFVMDGSSTDQSVDVIRRYAPWLTGWVSEPDDGQADAIGKGFTRSTGSIIAWLNSDDVYEPGAVATAAAHLMANPHIGAVYSDCHYIDLHSQRCGRYQADDYSIEGQYFYRNGIPQPTVFMRTELYHRVGGLDARFRFILDYELWLRMAKLAPMVRLPGTLANYRLWGDSHTVARPDQFLHEMLMLFNELAADPDLPAERRELARKAIAATHLKAAIAFSDRQEWRQAFDEIDLAKASVSPDEWEKTWWEWVGRVLSRRGQHRLQEGDVIRGLTDIAHGSVMSPRLLQRKLSSYLYGKRQGANTENQSPMDPHR